MRLYSSSTVVTWQASLLLLIDAAGLQAPLACSTPRNVQPQECSIGARRGRSPASLARNPDGMAGCYNTSQGTERWRAVAATMPALVAWYDERLRLFDAAVARRGPRFSMRVAKLRELRTMAARTQGMS